MLYVTDEFHIPAANIEEVLARINNVYFPHASERGYSLESKRIMPASGQQEDRILWVTWSLPDIMSFYMSRAGQSRVTMEFWMGLEPLITKRHRHITASVEEAYS